MLYLHVIEGKDLPKMGLLGKTDPYLTITLSDSNITHTTKVISNSLSPTWDQKFSFPVKSESQVLKIIMKDKNVVSDGCISSLEVPIRSLQKYHIDNLWYQMRPFGGVKSGGRIHLVLHYCDVNDKPFVSQTTTTPPPMPAPQPTMFSPQQTQFLPQQQRFMPTFQQPNLYMMPNQNLYMMPNQNMVMMPNQNMTMMPNQNMVMMPNQNMAMMSNQPMMQNSNPYIEQNPNPYAEQNQTSSTEQNQSSYMTPKDDDEPPNPYLNL